jgi:hypothetical protein
MQPFGATVTLTDAELSAISRWLEDVAAPPPVP